MALLPNFLGQKYPAQGFVVETLLDFSDGKPGELAGLAVVGGNQHVALALRKLDSGDEHVLIVNGAIATVGFTQELQVRIQLQVVEDGSFKLFLAEAQGGFRAFPQTFQWASACSSADNIRKGLQEKAILWYVMQY